MKGRNIEDGLFVRFFVFSHKFTDKNEERRMKFQISFEDKIKRLKFFVFKINLGVIE